MIPDSFLGLIESIRAVAPRAGIRSNVICGFPGETARDQEILADFLTAAELDAIGVFGYSDEDGTAAQGLPDQHPIELVESRRAQIADLADELVNQRAEDRIGESVRVLVEEVQPAVVGRAEHQGPEVDGSVRLLRPSATVRRGDLVDADGDRHRRRGSGRRDGGCGVSGEPQRPRVDRDAASASEKHPVGPMAEPETTPWNVPNALTAFRILLVPLFAWMLLSHPDDPWWRVGTAALFTVAILTDTLDGYLARKHNIVTKFGKLADPIADKALTGMALIGLSIIGELPWWVTIVILVREWGITVMRFAMLRYGVMAAGRGGKIKTVLQAVAIILYLLPLATVAPWAHVVAMIVMGAAFLITVLSGLDYVREAVRIRRQHQTS